MAIDASTYALHWISMGNANNFSAGVVHVARIYPAMVATKDEVWTEDLCMRSWRTLPVVYRICYTLVELLE